MTAALDVLTRDNLHLSESKQAIGEDEMAATLAAIDDAIGLVLDRRDVPGADVPLRVDPDGGDAGGAKVVFRKFVACRLSHAVGNEMLIYERSVEPRRPRDVETPPCSALRRRGPRWAPAGRLTPNVQKQQ